ncbi:hypothetical protein PNEG_02563 [Pneumocystis murina B123]|uniref:DH domain-containing protein n=1 Tax=Pneumocystis murina (strain B123) TaxID=1069680 RepID=M7NPP7_PNEMU|nr:hypothetical protein PNEG_02563 [Pneumocystis murina B123]EMR09227.1 hypothetical protein PNEG_02563 [Pneumocystis murina B123]
MKNNSKETRENDEKTLIRENENIMYDFSGGDSTIFWRNMTYEDMLDVDSFFKKNQIHYITDDPVVGLVLISVAVDKFNMIHAHVFTCCGPLSLPLISPKNQEALSIVISHLPHTSRSQSFQVIAMVILQYFIFIPLHIKKEVLRQYNYLRSNEDQERRIAFDEMHAGDIAGHCKLLKLSDISSILCSILKRRKIVSFNIDIILPDNSKSTPLFSKLQEMTSNEEKSGELPFENKKIVPGPMTDNYKEHDKKRLSILNEILQTEQNYIERLRHLVLDYVLPLRTQAKSSKNPPLGLYDINRIFPVSLNDIISLNSAFLQDFIQAKTEIEKANSFVTHFYRFKKTYAKYLELSVDFESLLRHNLRNPKFRNFVDNQKYKAEKNISIRELIMEPVQRIPRYSLFLENVISYTHPKSPALALFQKALTIIKEIAQMKVMEAEKRSKLFQKLMSYISGFPAELISNSRYFITAVDVIEILPPFLNSSGRLFYTLLLFSDCLAMLKKTSHIPVAKDLISNEDNSSFHRFRSRQNSFGFTTSVSRKDILFQCWANLDDLEIDIDENDDTNMWITVQAPVNSCTDKELWGSFSEHKMSIMSESKHCVIGFVEKFYRTKAKNKTSKNFIAEIEKSNINIICNVFEASEYKKERKKSEIAIQYVQQSLINAFERKFPKINISGLFLIEESSGIYRLDFHSPLSWKLSPQKFQYLDMLLENIFQKAILFHNFLKSWDSPKNVPFFISKYRFLLSCLFKLNSTSSSTKTIFPSITYFNSSNNHTSSILENSQLPPRDLAASLSHSNSLPKTFIKKSFLSFSLTKLNSENCISKFKNNGSSSLEIIKDRHIFHGAETFVHTLCSIEDFDSISTLTYSNSELKNAIELSNEIAKNPEKNYAILGSPLKIGYAAFKHYMKTHVNKKIGPILPQEFIKSCLNIIGEPDSIDEKISKIHDITLVLPQGNYVILYLVIYLTLHILNKTHGEVLKVLLSIVSEGIVPKNDVSVLIPILKFMTQNFSQVFYEFAKNNSASTLTTNNMPSTFFRNSNQSETTSSSFTNSLYDELFILPDTYTSAFSNVNNKDIAPLPLKNSLSLNCVQKKTSKKVLRKNTTSELSVGTTIPQTKSSNMTDSNIYQEYGKAYFSNSNKKYIKTCDNIEKKDDFLIVPSNFKISSTQCVNNQII